RDQAWQMLRIVREIGVHLADDVHRFLNRFADPVDVRATESAFAGAMHDGNQHGQVRPLVVGRDDDQGGHDFGPSIRSEEICSDTSPIRKITTLIRMSSTEEFVTCDCVAMVQMPYAAPTEKEIRLIGRKIRIGLKMVITFSRMSAKRSPSEPSLIFDLPCR